MAITYVDGGGAALATATTSYTVTLPAGAVEGDCFVVVVTTRDPHTVNSRPSGAVVVEEGENNGSSVTYSVYLWFAPASPPASITVGLSSAVAGSVVWGRFRGVDPTAPLAGDFTNGEWSAVASNFYAPAFSTTADGAFVVGGLTLPSGSRTVTVPSGWTEIFTAGERIGALAYEGEQATAGPAGSAQWFISGTALRGDAWQMALRPDAGGAAPDATLTYAWVGAPTAGGFTVSCKTAGAASVRLVASTNSSLTSPVYGTPATPDADGWAKAAITGLSSGTDYYYAVEMTNPDDATATSTVRGPVKTLPTAGAPASFSFTFGSCLNSGSTNSNAGNRMLARDPDLFFHLGDFHYADSTSTSAAIHRGHLETQLASNSGMASLLANVPTRYTVSDHDAGGGNGALPGAWTPANLAAYKQVVPHGDQPADAIYEAFVVGRVRFICTDHRYKRTASAMLDATQRAWFETQMQQPEPVKVWVMDSPWIISDAPVAPSSGGDKWSDYPTEHADIGDWIAANAVGQVIAIHGDMHALSADDGTNNAWGGFPVVGAAPFDRNTSVKGGPYSEGTWPAVGSATYAQQYGHVQVTDDGETVTLAYTGYDSTNTARITLGVVAAPPVTGTGGGSAPPAELAGTGALRLTGAGAVAATAALVAGVGLVALSGTGTATTPAPSLTATGQVALTGTGGATAGSPDLAGTGSLTATGAGSASPAAPSATGTMTLALDGTGTLAAPAPTLTGAGSIAGVIAGTGAAAPAPPTIAGAGALTLTGAGAAVPGPPTVNGPGTIGGLIAGTGTLAPQPPTLGGAGTLALTGNGSALADACTITAAGVVVIVGTGDATPPGAIVVGTGSVFDPTAFRDITLTVGPLTGHPLTASGLDGHPMRVTGLRPHPLTVTTLRS